MSDGPDDFQNARRVWEPSCGFDWDAVEDPVSAIAEEIGADLTHDQVRRVLEWHESRGSSHEFLYAAVIERALNWLGAADIRRGDLRAIRRPDRVEQDAGPPSERRFGLRAAILAKELAPYSFAGSMSVRMLAKVFGCSHGEVHRLREDFRRALGIVLPSSQESDAMDDAEDSDSET